MTGFEGATARTLDSGRVLVVDDDSSVLRGVARMLSGKGLVVDTAQDGSSAFAAVSSHIYDAMIIDLRMSSEDGLELLRRIRSLPNSPPAILHSAYLDVQTTVEAMKCGVDDVIEKSLSSSLLVDRVCELARRRKPSLGGAERSVERVGTGDPTDRILGDAAAIRLVRDEIKRISRFRDVAVLIEGETGTGKELIAEAIHGLSAPEHPFVALNCAAVPDQLLESELFGHEAGAFTSAKGVRVGLLEQAGEGTIFLDEIGEMPAAMQPKLLRALEAREFRRVGGNRSRPLRARVVSATNRSLRRAPADLFRSDLYFRLAGYSIASPPLRERTGDIPTLAREFAARFAVRYGLPKCSVTGGALDVLRGYRWPGNLRELRLVIENAAMLVAPAPIDESALAQILAARRADSDLPPGEERPRAPSGEYLRGVLMERAVPSLPEVERELITRTFTECAQNLTESAKRLGIPRSTLRDRLRKLGVR